MIYATGNETCHCCGRSRHTNSGVERPLVLTDKGWTCPDHFCSTGTVVVHNTQPTVHDALTEACKRAEERAVGSSTEPVRYPTDEQRIETAEMERANTERTT